MYAAGYGLRTGDITGNIIVKSDFTHNALLADADGKYSNAHNEQVLDSGATIHLTGNLSLLFGIEDTMRTVTLVLADGHRIDINTFGRLMIDDRMFVTNVGYVPRMKTTLISVSEIMRGDLKVVFVDKGASVLTPKDEPITHWRQVGGLFIHQLPKTPIPISYFATNAKQFDYILWNRIKKGDTGEPEPVPEPAPRTHTIGKKSKKKNLVTTHKGNKHDQRPRSPTPTATPKPTAVTPTPAPVVTPAATTTTPTATSHKPNNKTITVQKGTTFREDAMRHAVGQRSTRSTPVLPAPVPALASITASIPAAANFIQSFHKRTQY
jgi:hypothetical protein